MVRIKRRWCLLGSTALFAIGLHSSFVLTAGSAEAACTTNLAAFPAQPLPGGQSYVTLTSTGVVVPTGTTIVSNTTGLDGGDGVHIVPAPGGSGPFLVNNGNGCIETQGTVNITVGGVLPDRDGIRVIAADPLTGVAGNAEVYASAGTTILTDNFMGDGIIARSSQFGDAGANGLGTGNTIVHSQATITTRGIGAAGITTRNAGLLSEVISGGNITTTSVATTTNLGIPVVEGTYSAGISLVNQSTADTALARLIVNNNSTVRTAGVLSPAAYVAATGAAGIEIDTSLGTLIATGGDSQGLVANSSSGDVTAVVGNVNASGNFSQGIVAVSSAGGIVDLTIAAGATVMGGWQAGAGDVSAKTGVVSAGVIIGGVSANLTNNGTVGALSDRAITSGDLFTRVPNLAQPFPPGTYSPVGGSLTVENNGVVTGFVTLGTGAHDFDNAGIFDARHYADTDGNALRDTERVARSDFGGNAGTVFTNSNTFRLLTVAAPANADAAGQFVPTGLGGGYAAGAYDIGRDGVEQAQFLNLATFVNSGVITMQDGETGGTGPVAGDLLVITGGAIAGGDGGGVFRTGGALRLDTVLNQGSPANSISDILVVDSTDSSAGPTFIAVANAGGAGGSTDLNNNGVVDEGEGILVVDVRNAQASADDAFALGGPVRAGAWSYDLFWGATGGDWYLVNFFAPTVWHPVLPSPLGLPGLSAPHCDAGAARAEKGMAGDGDRETCGCGTPDAWRLDQSCRDNNLWTRIEGGYAKRDSDGDEDGYKVSHWMIQAGYERMGWDGEENRFAFGPFAHLQNGKLTSIDALRDTDGAAIDFLGYGGGLTAAWDNDDGFYLDAMGQVTFYDLDVEDADGAESGAEGGTDGWSYGLTAEAGKSFRAADRLMLVPHGGLLWNAVDIDSYRGSDGVDRAFGTVESLIGYAGLRADYTKPITDSYFDAWMLSGTAKVEHEFDGDSTVTSSDSASSAESESTLDGEDTRLALIGSVAILQGDEGAAHRLGLTGGYTTSLERDSDAYRGSLEFKVSW